MTERTTTSVRVRLPDHLNYEILLQLQQPITATQLSVKTERTVDACNYALTRLAELGFLRCLNPKASRSRLFWLTHLGNECQTAVLKQRQLHGMQHDVPAVDWKLYGTVCYSHRAAVIKTLDKPMQPADIKRKARFEHPEIRMSANNVRDVIRFLKTHGVVQPVHERKRGHPLYELTRQGRHFRRLLIRAEIKE